MAEAYKATVVSSYFMAGGNIVQAPTTKTKGNGVKQGDNANQPRVHSARASSSSSQQPSPTSHRVSSRKPDGTSQETSLADLRSLEQALRRESVVDGTEIGPLTVPSTPVRDSIDGISNDVRINLELASVKLSKLAPGD